MGVYYYFFNKSLSFTQNEQVINGRFCDFVTNFDSYSHQQQCDFFKLVISKNNWSESDIILAVPDYPDHDLIEYDISHPDLLCHDNTHKLFCLYIQNHQWNKLKH
jgi:hypothetical protein